MAVIEQVGAREILDSRGNPTVEVEVALDDGTLARAAVPSGASTGEHEAVELRDGDPLRFGGKGVEQAVSAVLDEIGPELTGMEAVDQRLVDQRLVDLDGTPDKSPARRERAARRLARGGQGGGRVVRAGAVPLRRRPERARAAGADDEHHQRWRPRRQLGRRAGVHDRAGRRRLLPGGAALGRRGLPGAEVGAQGQGPGHRAGRRGRLRSRPARHPRRAGPDRRGRREDRLHARPRHRARPRRGRHRVPQRRRLLLRGPEAVLEELSAVYAELVDAYPLVSIEDPLSEDDWDGWVALTEAIGDKVQLVGDDLFVTNPERLDEGISRGAANALLVKVNQIGTLSETLDAVTLAQSSGYRCMMSHRSGETEDTTIADLAVATGCGQIKTGAPARSERVAKYNQLLRIEEALGDAARYAGDLAFPRLQLVERESGA